MLHKHIILIFTIFQLISCDESFQEDAKVIADNSVPSIQLPMGDDDEANPLPTSAPVRSGSFIGRNNYNVVGDVELLFDPVSDTYTLVLLNNFSSQSGPDLRVYLSTFGGVNADSASLGLLKSNNGSSSYTFSANDFNPSFSSVLIWCEAFSVLFAEASI